MLSGGLGDRWGIRVGASMWVGLGRAAAGLQRPWATRGCRGTRVMRLEVVRRRATVLGETRHIYLEACQRFSIVHLCSRHLHVVLRRACRHAFALQDRHDHGDGVECSEMCMACKTAWHEQKDTSWKEDPEGDGSASTGSEI